MIPPLLAQAKTHVDQDRLDDALPLLRRAATLTPDPAGIHHDIGYLLLRLGRFGKAADAFRAAIAAQPDFALAHVRLGVALQAAGDRDEALAAYGRAAELDPRRADAPFRAGVLLEALGFRVSAMAALRRAAATRPASALSRLAAVRLQLDAGRYKEAEPALRTLLALHPGHLEATDTLGSVLADAGRFDAAWSCYDHVTRASPQYAGSFYDLVRCRTIGRADADLVDRMSTAAARSDLHTEARVKLHLALGKAADDLDRPGEAMRQYGIASSFRVASDERAAAVIGNRVDRAIELFDARRLAGAAKRGDRDRTAILIVGLPRSGTTLVEQILSCHPDVGGAGELPFWFERAAVLDDEDASARGEAAADYLRLLREAAPSARHVTDKMPLNVLHLGLIHLCLPRATLVLCRRRPIDVALSIHRTHFNRDGLVPTGGAPLVAAVRAIERLSAHWRSILPPGQLHELFYERLVADRRNAIGALLAACGLPWNEACVRPEHNPRVVRTPSRWQVRQPITAAPADAWRRYEPWLGPLADLC